MPPPAISSAALLGLPEAIARLSPGATEVMEHIWDDPDALKAVGLLCGVEGYLATRKLHVVGCVSRINL